MLDRRSRSLHNTSNLRLEAGTFCMTGRIRTITDEVDAFRQGVAPADDAAVRLHGLLCGAHNGTEFLSRGRIALHGDGRHMSTAELDTVANALLG
jgi:hypothetical protein